MSSCEYDLFTLGDLSPGLGVVSCVSLSRSCVVVFTACKNTRVNRRIADSLTQIAKGSNINFDFQFVREPLNFITGLHWLGKSNTKLVYLYPKMTTYSIILCWLSETSEIYDGLNPIQTGGEGAGGVKVHAPISTSRTSLIFKQYLPNVAKIYWRTRFWKIFASKVSFVTLTDYQFLVLVLRINTIADKFPLASGSSEIGAGLFFCSARNGVAPFTSSTLVGAVCVSTGVPCGLAYNSNSGW